MENKYTSYKESIEEEQVNPPVPVGHSYLTQHKQSIAAKAPTLELPPFDFPQLPEATMGEEEEVSWYQQPARMMGKGFEAIAKPFNWINEHIEKPWAALLVLAKQGLTPGVQDIEAALSRRKLGDSWWDTLKSAYESKELKGWQKFALEMTLPLWWVFPVGAGAKVAGTGIKAAQALGMVSKTGEAIGVTGKIVHAIKNAPVIRAALRENIVSKSFNAPFRNNDLFFDLRGMYDKLQLGDERLLQNIMGGKLAIDNSKLIKSIGAYKPGAKKIEVLDIIMNDQKFRKTLMLELPTFTEQVANKTMTMEQVVTWIGGNLRQHIAASKGVTLPKVTNTVMQDAYAFWKAGVLTTPWYVMQNWFEDVFRVSVSMFKPARVGGLEFAFPIGKFRMPIVKDLWSAIRGKPIPDDLMNTALSRAARFGGFTNVAQLRASVEAGIIKAQKEIRRTRRNPVLREKATASLLKYQRILEEVPRISESMKMSPSMIPTDAIMEGALLQTKEHPLTRWTEAISDKTIGALVKATDESIGKLIGQRGLPDAYEKLKKAGKTALRAPRAEAGFIDSSAKIKIWLDAYEDYMGLFATEFKMPSRNRFMNNIVTKEAIEELTRLGVTPDQVKALRTGLRDARTSDDIRLAFANIYDDPLPRISEMPANYVVPANVWNSYIPDIQLGILSGNKETIKAAGKAMKKDTWTHMGDVRENYRNLRKELEVAGIEDLPALKRIFKSLDEYTEDLISKKEKFWAKQTEIYPPEFLEKEKARRIVFETQIEQNRAEMEVLKGLILHDQKAIMKGTKPSIALTAEIEEVVHQRQMAARGLSDEFRDGTWVLSDFMKSGASEEEIIKVWAAQWEIWRKRDPILIRGMTKSNPSVSKLWNNYALGQSEIHRKAVVEIAEKFGLEKMLPKYHLPTWWLEAQANIDDVVRRATTLLDRPSGITADIMTRYGQLGEMKKTALSFFKKYQGTMLKEWEVQTKARNYASATADSIMGNYATSTDLDSFMNKIVPFWYFPSRSIPYYTRTFMQKPYLLSHLERYLNNTDLDKLTPESLVGYLPIPAGDQYFFVNPFRPWMGYQLLGWEPLAGVGQPTFQQGMQMFNMMGIGFNPAITWSLETINAISTPLGYNLTRGEPMPLFPQLKWLQDIGGGITGEWMPEISQLLFSQTIDGMPDWERRNTEKELARWIGNNPELASQKDWKTPKDITFAAKSDPEAKKIVSDQIRRMSHYGLLSVVFPIYNRRNTEEIKMMINREDAVMNIMESNGKSKEEIEALLERADKIGFSPMMYFNKQQRQEIYDAHPEWEPWQGLTRVGISPAERDMENQTSQFYQYISKSKEQLINRIEIADSAFADGLISGYDWRLIYEDVQTNNAAIWEFLIGDGLAPDKSRNPGALPLARVTPERAEYYRNLHGKAIPPIHPEDIALNYYYSIIPEIDPELGTYDFDTYFVRRDSFFNSMPYEIQEYIKEDKRRTRYDSPVEEQFRLDRELMTTYFAVRRDVLAEFPEYKMLMEQLKGEQDPRQRELLSKRVSKYERIISKRREQLRATNAKLEAVLFKWGYVSSMINSLTPNFIE